MTWVIGVPTIFGYSVVLADIQATIKLLDGRKKYFDVIQKIFPVGKFVAAGFAGSVEIGYLLIEDLTRWCVLPAGKAWIPECLAHDWHRRARFIFSRIPSVKRQKTELLLVAVYPQLNDGISGEPQTYSCIMRSPNFEPELIRPGKVGSIGSGNNVVEYKKALESLNTGYNPLMQMEMGNPGGYGEALSIALSLDVKNTPAIGISSHLHIAQVKRGKIIIGPNNHITFDDKGNKIPFVMPKVATSWKEFKSRMLIEGINLAEVIAMA